MVDESIQMDIRRLLKTFGVQADTAILQHLQQHPDLDRLQIRVRLEDLTDYPDKETSPLSFSVEGTITRSK